MKHVFQVFMTQIILFPRLHLCIWNTHTPLDPKDANKDIVIVIDPGALCCLCPFFVKLCCIILQCFEYLPWIRLSQPISIWFFCSCQYLPLLARPALLYVVCSSPPGYFPSPSQSMSCSTGSIYFFAQACDSLEYLTLVSFLFWELEQLVICFTVDPAWATSFILFGFSGMYSLSYW